MTTVRRMERPEVDMAVEWAAREGWSPGIGDAEPFFAADPEGFFLAEVDGVPAGTISAVAYDGIFGFIGLFIVAPPFRGSLIALRLGRAAMAHLGDRNIGLDGVMDRQEDYAQLGFRAVCRNTRYRVVFPRVPFTGSDQVVDLASVSFACLAEYDRRHFPAPRDAFLRMWIRPYGGHSLGIVDGRKLHGYGVIRPFRAGFRIGPLFADNPDVAEVLLLRLAEYAGGIPILIDVPGLNRDAIKLASRYNMQVASQTVRMYTRGCPDVEHQGVYGLTTLELG